jgi:hypothetical protein
MKFSTKDANNFKNAVPKTVKHVDTIEQFRKTVMESIQGPSKNRSRR